jgi:hypothetical protein
LAGSGWAGTKERFALGHWALTGSRPSADVTLIMLRVADLASALLDGLAEQPARRQTQLRTSHNDPFLDAAYGWSTRC